MVTRMSARMPQPGGVTLTAVALRAGVSKSTASKALSGRGDVAVDTARRVARIAAEMGYAGARVGTAAGKRRGRRTTGPITLWVAFDTLTNDYVSNLIDGILDESAEIDASIVFAHDAPFNPRGPHPVPSRPLLTKHDGSLPVRRRSTDGGPPRSPRPGTAEWARTARSRGAHAIILITLAVTQELIDTCAEIGLPLVAVDPANHPPAEVLTVGATNWRGGVLAAEHVLGHGHRRIAFVGAPASSLPGDERLAGFRSAMHGAGIEVDEDWVRVGAFQYEDGLACEGMLSQSPRPTAVVAACDAVALGVLEAARRLGLDVPGDLSVVGFDDSYGAAHASPPLTTVHQPLAAMGRIAVRAAVDAVRLGRSVPPPLQLQTTLVVRETTGPAPA